MVTNTKEYMNNYMKKYYKGKGAETFLCTCGKTVRNYEKSRHNKTTFHNKLLQPKETEIELLKKEIESLKAQLTETK